MRRGHLAILLLLGCASCAPSAKQYVADKEYSEAVCAVTQFGGTDAERTYVLEHIEQDAEPSLNVYGVTREELARAVGEASAEQVAEQAVLLRVSDDYNTLSLWNMELAVSLRGGGKTLETAPASREMLAVLTREVVPQPTTVKTGGTVLDKVTGSLEGGLPGVAAGLGEALTLGIVPFTQIFGFDKRESHTHYPTDEEYLQRIPAAETLRRSIDRDSSAGSGREGPRRSYLVVERPKAQDLRLVVEWSYGATSYAGPCRLTRRFELALPPGDTLEARVNALFRNRMVRLAELRGRAMAR